MKTSAQRLEILRSKFARSERSVKEPNWEFTGSSIIIFRDKGNVEIFEDRFIYDSATFKLSNVKEVFWMGKGRPHIKDLPSDEAQEFKMNNYDLLGFELRDSLYFEINDLGDSYADFLKYIEWAKEYGGL